MWQRFTERARNIIAYSQEEAARRGTRYVTAEHLLFALLREEDHVAGKILQRLGVSQAAIEAQVEPPSWPPAPKPPFAPGQDMQLAPDAKNVIDRSYQEAKALRNNYIGTEHLLLGLTGDQGTAGRALAQIGITSERARAEVVHLQGGPAAVVPKKSRLWGRILGR